MPVGTPNQIAKFGPGGLSVVDSRMSDDGSDGVVCAAPLSVYDSVVIADAAGVGSSATIRRFEDLATGYLQLTSPTPFGSTSIPVLRLTATADGPFLDLFRISAGGVASFGVDHVPASTIAADGWDVRGGLVYAVPDLPAILGDYLLTADLPAILGDYLTETEADALYAPLGSGGGWNLSNNTLSNASVGAQATKGVLVVPVVDTTVRALWFQTDEINAGVYKASIYSLTGLAIATTVAHSAAHTATATATTYRRYVFAPEITLTAGTRYALVHTRTDLLDTTASGIYTGTMDAAGTPTQRLATFVNLAKKAPAVADVFGSGANPYFHGIEWTF